MELSELLETAEEVNRKLKLIPVLKTDANEGELIKQLKGLNDFVGFDRYLSGEAMEVIQNLKKEMFEKWIRKDRKRFIQKSLPASLKQI